MPTPSEQKALAFIASIILLGGAVRVVRAGSTPRATDAEQQQVARQAHAADSAAGAQVARKGAKVRVRKTRAVDTLPHVVGGVSSVPATFARPDQPNANAPYTIDIDHATALEIEKLPRIGPSTAKRIVANRDSLGPFKTLQGLRRVKGMGVKTLEQLAPFLTFGH